MLKSLPPSLGQLGALEQLTLAWLEVLEVLPEAVLRLTSLGSLTMRCCVNLRTLPRGIGKLGALRELTLYGLSKLQEMPDLIGLTALGSLTIEYCGKLRALPRGMGELGALKQLSLCRLDELQEIPDTIGRMTALELLTLGRCRKLRTLPASIMHLSRLQKLSIRKSWRTCRASRPSRLGAASSVSWLDSQALVMIADEVLGGRGLPQSQGVAARARSRVRGSFMGAAVCFKDLEEA